MKRTTKKLTLAAETLKLLTTAQMHEVGGGAPITRMTGCTQALPQCTMSALCGTQQTVCEPSVAGC